MLTLLVGFMVVRLPLRSDFLVNWDAANFALGVSEGFDLQHHQPHPPGYIGYVVVGRALTWLTNGDANAALTLMSVIAGGIVPSGLYLLARRFVDRRAALVSALLFGSAPLVWHYSVVALTYIVAAAIIIPLVLACHVARSERSGRHLILAGALLALLGAFRQTDMVLLAPVMIYSAAALPRRDRWTAGLITAILTAVWLVPLLWLSGGPAAYVHQSANLANKAGGQTWFFSLKLEGLMTNLQMVALGIGAGMFVGLVPLVRSLRQRVSPLALVERDDRRFLLLWAAPALGVYLLLHTGQLGYVLVILPIGYLAVALVLAHQPASGVAPLTLRSKLAVGVVANTAAFLVLPSLGDSVRVSQVEDGGEAVAGVVATDEAQELIDRDVQPISLLGSDEYWQNKIELIEEHDPRRSVVLTSLGGSFRQLSYYTPSHEVYALGFDAEQRFGQLFRARGMHNDYEIDRLEDEGADRTIDLPPSVDEVVIADPYLQEWVEPEGRSRVRSTIDGTAVLFSIPVERGSTVRLGGSAPGADEEDPVIEVVTPSA